MPSNNWGSPKVITAISSWHIGNEIEPLPVGRERWMGIRRQCVGCYFQRLRLTPFGIVSCGSPYFRHARILRVGTTHREIHGVSVLCETRSALVPFRIQFTFCRLWTFPMSFFVFFQAIDVSRLRTSYATHLSARTRISSGGKINGRTVTIWKSRTIICPWTAEVLVQFDSISRTSLPDGGSFLRRPVTSKRQHIFWILFKICFILLFRALVIACVAQHVALLAEHQTVGNAKPFRILIGR